MIRSVYLKFLIQKIRRNRKIMPGVGCCFEFLFGSRTNAGFTHDSGHTVFAALNPVIDLSREQYEALHDGRRANGLELIAENEFVIERVGESDERHFADVGIEYYKYVS